MAKVTSRDGTEIGYEKVGSGPLLIIVTGATQFRATDPGQARLAELLGGEFTVISYDRRGRGESGDKGAYAVRKEIDDIAALIEANGGRASLLGYSSGAILAVEAAAAGLPVDKVIAYEPPFVVEGSGRDPDRDHLLPNAEAALEKGDNREVARIFFRDGVGIPANAFEGMMASPFGQVLEAIAPTLTYDLHITTEAYPHQQWPERFGKTTTPVLFLDGDRTFPFIPKGVDAFAKQMPNSSRRTLPGQDHGPKPEAIAPVIRDFLGT